jgi:hypothetical protein
MSERNDELLLDRLIHEPGRLAILTVLSSVQTADFVFLQRTTGLTKGKPLQSPDDTGGSRSGRDREADCRQKPNTNRAPLIQPPGDRWASRARSTFRRHSALTGGGRQSDDVGLQGAQHPSGRVAHDLTLLVGQLSCAVFNDPGDPR